MPDTSSPRRRRTSSGRARTRREALRQFGYRVVDRIFRPREPKVPTGHPRRRRKLLLAAILGLATLILSFQIGQFVRTRRAVAQTRRDYEYYQNRILEEEAKAQALNEDFEALSKQREETLAYLYGTLSGSGFDPETLARIRFINRMAGMTEVTGAGLRITLADAADIGYTGNDRSAIIHDADVRGTVNLIKGDGSAEAIAVNGERLVPTSRLICTGPTILVNRNYMSMPFVLEVVGDPDSLETTFRESKLYRDFVDRGLQLKVERLDALVIPAFYDRELMDHNLAYLEEAES